MKTIIYLIRHTQTVGNIEKRLTGRQDYVLTSEGIQYVKKLEKELENIKFDIAYCSSSDRTRKTIQGLANKNHIQIIQDENLCEMYFGIYDGWKWEDVNKVNPQIEIMHKKTNEIMEIEDQETTEQVATRMYQCILNIVKKNVGKTILICSHGVAIEAFLRKITGEPFTKKSGNVSSCTCINYHKKRKVKEIYKSLPKMCTAAVPPVPPMLCVIPISAPST